MLAFVPSPLEKLALDFPSIIVGLLSRKYGSRIEGVVEFAMSKACGGS